MTDNAPNSSCRSTCRRGLRLQFLIILLLVMATTLLASSKLGYPWTGIDDANTYFVYARNLANGHGFVYHIGREKAEGFTSLLWTLIAALAFGFSPRPEPVLLGINIALVSLGITLSLNHLHSASSTEPAGPRAKYVWSAIFVLIVLTSPVIERNVPKVFSIQARFSSKPAGQ